MAGDRCEGDSSLLFFFPFSSYCSYRYSTFFSPLHLLVYSFVAVFVFCFCDCLFILFLFLTRFHFFYLDICLFVRISFSFYMSFSPFFLPLMPCPYCLTIPPFSLSRACIHIQTRPKRLSTTFRIPFRTSTSCDTFTVRQDRFEASIHDVTCVRDCTSLCMRVRVCRSWPGPSHALGSDCIPHLNQR